MDNKLNTLHQLVKTQDDNISLLNAKFKALQEVLLKQCLTLLKRFLTI